MDTQKKSGKPPLLLQWFYSEHSGFYPKYNTYPEKTVLLKKKLSVTKPFIYHLHNPHKLDKKPTYTKFNHK